MSETNTKDLAEKIAEMLLYRYENFKMSKGVVDVMKLDIKKILDKSLKSE